MVALISIGAVVWILTAGIAIAIGRFIVHG
jgi:hypothetical protein